MLILRLKEMPYIIGILKENVIREIYDGYF